MRINKLFSNMGICSRKETNKLIEDGRVKVNGKICVQGQWVEEEDQIFIDDQPIKMKKKIYIVFNKPVGITCTAAKDVKNNIIHFINYPEYIFPVGRLDKESEGLILMTNDGELANNILQAENNHEKEYIVTVDKPFDDSFIKKMSEGVEIKGVQCSGVKRISDTLAINMNNTDKELIELKQYNKQKNNIVKTKKCTVIKLNEKTFKIILTQGLNKQIRKMSKALGYEVVKLERIRIMNVKLKGIEKGKWRELNNEEIMEMKKVLQSKESFYAEATK